MEPVACGEALRCCLLSLRRRLEVRARRHEAHDSRGGEEGAAAFEFPFPRVTVCHRAGGRKIGGRRAHTRRGAGAASDRHAGAPRRAFRVVLTCTRGVYLSYCARVHIGARAPTRSRRASAHLHAYPSALICLRYWFAERFCSSGVAAVFVCPYVPPVVRLLPLRNARPLSRACNNVLFCRAAGRRDLCGGCVAGLRDGRSPLTRRRGPPGASFRFAFPVCACPAANALSRVPCDIGILRVHFPFEWYFGGAHFPCVGAPFCKCTTGCSVQVLDAGIARAHGVLQVCMSRVRAPRPRRARACWV